MFRRISEDITFWLIKNKVLDIKNREIYVYGTEVILLNVSLLIVTFIISALENGFLHFISFLIFFIPIRIFSGGYHAKHSETCFLLSTVAYTVTLFIVKWKPYMYKNIEVLIFLGVAVACILRWSPLKNPRHPLADYQCKRNKKILFGIIAVDFALFVMIYRFDWEIVASEVIFILLNAVILIIGKLEVLLAAKEC